MYCRSKYMIWGKNRDHLIDLSWHCETKEFGLTLLVGVIRTNHSPARSPYWSARRLLAAGFPLWPGAPLPRQPDPLGLPRGGHADADLSADASSTWFGCNQYSLPHIIPISDFPDAGLQELATLPVRGFGENYLSQLASCIYVHMKKNQLCPDLNDCSPCV